MSKRAICALSVIAQVLMDSPEELDDVAERIAPLADLDATLLLRSARLVLEQMEEAAARGR